MPTPNPIIKNMAPTMIRGMTVPDLLVFELFISGILRCAHKNNLLSKNPATIDHYIGFWKDYYG
jgi:hypothetical protein